MFTGIIREVIKVKRIIKSGQKMRICLPIEGASLGDSIAVNGVCLTVDEITREGVFFTIMGKTLAQTTLKFLRAGKYVNAEKALKLGDSVSGHFVYGHVCSIGSVLSIRKRPGEYEFWFSAPNSVIAKLREKGSVAIDGVSLTVQDIRGNKFSAAIVGHTYKNTIFQYYRPGDKINIEYELYSL